MYELEETEYYRNLARVTEMIIKGETNPTKISKALSIPRKDVIDYISAWKEIARNTDTIKDRAAEALSAMDKHYDLIIQGFWDVIEETTDLKTKAAALKNLADVEAKRQETLQKAGLYDDAGVSDELVRLEEENEAIRQVLFTVVKQYPDTKVFIMEQFSKMGNPQRVDDDQPIRGQVIEQ